MSTLDDDAAVLRAMRGAKFGPGAKLILPTGRTLSGDEAALWSDVETIETDDSVAHRYDHE